MNVALMASPGCRIRPLTRQTATARLTAPGRACRSRQAVEFDAGRMFRLGRSACRYAMRLHRTAGVDRPDVDQRIALDDVIDVVEVHGRVAVRRQAFERASDRQVPGRVLDLDPAVLVAEEEV